MTVVCVGLAFSIREVSRNRVITQLIRENDSNQHALDLIPTPRYPKHWFHVQFHGGRSDGHRIWPHRLQLHSTAITPKQPADWRKIVELSLTVGDSKGESGVRTRYLWTIDDRDLYEVVIYGPPGMPNVAGDQMCKVVMVYPSYRGEPLLVYEDDRVTVTFEPPEPELRQEVTGK